MAPEMFAAVVALIVFTSGVAGLYLQGVVNEKHTTGPSRDMIGAVVGLLTLLCALVTGLLIWTAYGVYAGQNAAIQTIASKALQLDLALEDYGPDAKPERLALRKNLGDTIDRVWNGKGGGINFVASNFAAAVHALRDSDKDLERLQPATDDQKRAHVVAKSAIESIAQSRLQMSFALTATVSYPLLLTVVGWVVLLFCGFGLLSRGGVMPVVCLAVGAFAISTAVLLILDLSNPYVGLFRASPEPLLQVLAVMPKE